MIILSLGSNLGDRLQNLKNAALEIEPIFSESRRSYIYESNALLPENSPEEWNLPFLNACISGNTDLTAEELLKALQTIEQKQGREVGKKRWAPRIIDIDILIYHDLIMNSDILTIPHKSLLVRMFYLHPLVDLAPDWKYPIEGPNYGKSARELLSMQNVENAFTITNTHLKL